MNWFLTLIRNDCWLQICCGIDTYEKNFGLTFHLTIMFYCSFVSLVYQRKFDGTELFGPARIEEIFIHFRVLQDEVHYN